MRTVWTLQDDHFRVDSRFLPGNSRAGSRHLWRMPGVNCPPPQGGTIEFHSIMKMIDVDGRGWSSYRISFVHGTVYGISWRVSKQCFQGRPPSFARMAHDEINCLNQLRIIVERWLRKIGGVVRRLVDRVYGWTGSFSRFERRRSLNNSLNRLVKVMVILFCFKYVSIRRVNYLRLNYFGANMFVKMLRLEVCFSGINCN